MRKLYLPQSLSKVGSEFFYGSTALKTLSYSGTAAQWNKVTKEENWSKNLPGALARVTDYESKS